ncbi:hypothetical protein GCM10022267_89130 [Lentzea roselyniae]|uniref:Mutator family transposase n=1 Tax=Lentzea roselyniae TaxID=531940 RepID=A0ABP7CFU7_9PSEU
MREGARRMLAEAVQAEVDAYIARFREELDEHGHRLVVRNGYHQPREMLTSAGAVEVTVPRVVGGRDPRQHPLGGTQTLPPGDDRRPRRRPQGTRRPGRRLPRVHRVVGDLLRDCARRSMRAPVLAVGDGALGFWGALREVFPDTREQRCWFHKIGNVLAALPKSAQPGAKKALAEIWNAEDKRHALDAVTAFDAAYGAKFPKATAKITDDVEELLAFYDYPAEHWIHLRTTNPIELTFATVRHRTKVTKGPGTRAAGLAMALKLLESAQARWRAVNAPQLVALVRAGARFENGTLVERPDEHTPASAA